MAKTGTMLARIEQHANDTPTRPVLHDNNASGGWEVTTWKGYWDRARAIGRGLMAVGVQRQDCVAIVGANRSAWVLCQHGINAAAAIPAPLYTTLLPKQMAYIIDNAQAKVGICDDAVQLAKFIEIANMEGSTLELIVTMDDLASDDPRVMTLAALEAKGESVPEAELDARLDAVELEDTALLIYTSGTTGPPKGAIVSHEGIQAITEGALDRYGAILTPELRYISYLPLCHAAEQGMTNFAGLASGGQVYFCREMSRIKDMLTEVRPMLFLGVPRVWEKLEAVLRGKLAEAHGLRAALARWALKTEHAGFEADVAGRPGPLLRGLARWLVIDKIKRALGFDALVLALSGAAPISRSTLEFFASIGVVIHEGYGMTETSAFASGQPLGRPRFGTIGLPLSCTQVKIAADGEIMLRGKNMVKGYWRLPDKTAELYDDEGWMHTGDLGLLDADGYIVITGRKKDLIITAGGKNIAPVEMESYIRGIPGVGQVVVVGDARPYLVALIVLDAEALPELEHASGASGLRDLASAASNAKVRAFFEGQIERECNAKVARYQTIKKFDILDHEFSVATGELTPTLKVKRNVVSEKYADRIAALYDS